MQKQNFYKIVCQIILLGFGVGLKTKPKRSVTYSEIVILNVKKMLIFGI